LSNVKFSAKSDKKKQNYFSMNSLGSIMGETISPIPDDGLMITLLYRLLHK